MNVANLGDSGFLVIRYDEMTQSFQIVKKSKEQQHSFNTPYQLANIPKDKFKAKIADQFWSDEPTLADTYQVKLKPGDIIMLATDGLFDNLFKHEILRVVDDFVKQANCITPKLLSNERSGGDSLFSRNRPCVPEYNHVEDLDADDARQLAIKLAQSAYTKAHNNDCLTPFGKRVNKLLKN
eukprot:CAMPEP_0168318512 /NCGR_PEP_ID=MMETSP0213-20121227/522_1 /TAXON_ID=151035 /ORGANISM="Euplotes harpa, Strain FSP1.4" /LENGTH=180 /DNA_ID=CAMNT_0008319591 /DNA_START=1671 /DNA_END=2213 /DNA_ORIENTATION=-